ncbi:reverse transcriptase [Trichonephila clavipes]|nr:reverse transcriptase [Trichonephila clavipes]
MNKCTAVTQKTKSLGKPWETLTTVGPIPRHLEKAEAIARFHQTTVLDLLGVYVHLLGLDADEACPLSVHTRMDGDNL